MNWTTVGQYLALLWCGAIPAILVGTVAAERILRTPRPAREKRVTIVDETKTTTTTSPGARSDMN